MLLYYILYVFLMWVGFGIFGACFFQFIYDIDFIFFILNFGHFQYIFQRMIHIKNNIILNTIYNSFYTYPTPINLNYFWNFGIYSFLCLAIQIATGIFLAMHYIPDINFAFDSVEHIMRDVNYGYILRYVHSNGASMFFIVVYVHIFKNLYYGSYLYPRNILWVVGVIIFFLMIIIAFMGYVLPQGQMPFWGATVITNLFSAIPFVGNKIVVQLWGGYSISDPTLTRFFSLHFFLPFILFALVIIHLIYLHRDGSNNNIGINFIKYDFINMYPYYIIKDLFGVIIFIMFFSVFVFFYPNVLGHTDNYINANPFVTPVHIVPEQYLLPFYAILRSIPNKLIGVVALVSAIFILVFIPIIAFIEVKSYVFKPLSQIFFQIFFVNTVLLAWIGAMPVQYPFVFLGQMFTIFYFSYFIFINYFINYFEKYIWVLKDLLELIILFLCNI